MRDSQTPRSEIRSITLPSGRQVEISYLDGEAVSIADQGLVVSEIEAGLQESVNELLNCGECGCDTVQPVEWDGFPIAGRAPDHAHCSVGVDVEAFGLVPAHA